MIIMDEIFKKWLSIRGGYKPLNEWNPAMIKIIIERHPTPDNLVKGFIERIIMGYPGYGKSMFAYKFMAKLCWVLNGYTKMDNEEDCYKWSLSNMIYRPEEFFSKIDKQIELDEPDWIWTLDDASIHFGKQLWDRNRAVYRRLQDKVPLIRDYVTCLFITTIKVQLLAKPLREFFDKKVNMTLTRGIQCWTRQGKHYMKEYYPDDIRFRVYHPYDDRFSCLVPEPFYSWYEDKKHNALKEYNREKKDDTREEDEDIDES